jgi:hypothetical protein
MNLFLQIESGPQAGERAPLPHGRSMMVGSGAPARFVVAGDSALAKVHFSIEFVSQTCRVSDLKTASGTLVNGEPIARAVVKPGDRITAGSTTFVVCDGDGPPPPPPPRADAPAPAAISMPAVSAAVAAQATAAAARRPIALKEQVCLSGLRRLTPEEPKTIWEEAYRRLAAKWTPYVVADLQRLGLKLPPDVKEPRYLLDWLPLPAAVQVSPLILTQADTRQFDTLLKQGWGNDGLVCWFAAGEPAAIIAHLRAIATTRTGDERENRPPSMVGTYIPGMLNLMLGRSETAEAQRLIAGMEAVLLEGLRGRPWQVYGNDAALAPLNEIGFRRPAEAEKE